MATDPEVLGSIPSTSRFSERQWVWSGVHSASWVLMSITEELLGRNSSGSGQENREYNRGDPLHWPRNTLYPQKLVLLHQEAAVARSAQFAGGPKPRSFFYLFIYLLTSTVCRFCEWLPGRALIVATVFLFFYRTSLWGYAPSLHKLINYNEKFAPYNNNSSNGL
jgi:hypothetical protein